MSAFVEDGFPVPRALELCVLGADRPDIRAIEEEGAKQTKPANGHPRIVLSFRGLAGTLCTNAASEES